jgi:ParB family chromosome partitioning protein
MGKHEALLRESGSNMLESIAVLAAVPPPSAGSSPGALGKLQGVSRIRNAMEIPIDRIVSDPNQPRKTFPQGSLDELAASLAADGQLQPILVRWVEEINSYKIIAGNRRHTAARQANLKTMHCIVVERDLTEVEIRALQLIENIHRQDLNALEKARAFRELMEEHKCSQRELAKIVHLDVATVNATLALLSLPADIQEKVSSGAISPSVASEIAKMKDQESQHELASRVVNEKLTREHVRQTTRKPRRKEPEPKAPTPTGTAITYNLPLGKATLMPNKAHARSEDRLALARQLVLAVESEVAMKAPAVEAA